MKRPFKDVRPVGPFAQREESGSDFDQVEVQRNSEDEDRQYTVAGVFNPGASGPRGETVGLVLKVDALTVNGDNSFAIDEEGARAVFTAPMGETVSIVDKEPELADIQVR